MLVQNSAFVPNVQKYTGPELKGARTRAADEVPYEDDGMVEPEVVVNPEFATHDVAADKGVNAGTSETPKRGRGRPPKAKPDSAGVTPSAASNEAPGSAKKRGRPPKLKTPVKTPATEEKTDVEETEKESPSEPKRRGRPPKAKADAASKEAVSKALEEAPAKEEDEDEVDAASPVTPKRRGRPPKAKPEAAEETEVTKKAKKDEEDAVSPAGSAEPKKRGRPAKAKPETDAATTPTPKKRGRPPKA